MTEKQLSNEEKAKMSEVLAQKGSSLAGIAMSVAQTLQALEEQKQTGQLSNEDVEVYNQIMSNEGVKKFLEKTSEKNDVSQIKENDTGILEKAWDTVVDGIESGWNAIKDGVEYLNPFASNEIIDKSETIEQKNQKTLEKTNILQTGIPVAGIGMGVVQALQALEVQKQNGQLSNEDVEVYNQIMSNEGVKKFLEKTSEKNDVSQIKENDTGILEKAWDTVVDGIESGWNAIKDGVEYLNSFASNDTLNNAGQKVNPDATEQTQMMKDNSKDMA